MDWARGGEITVAIVLAELIIQVGRAMGHTTANYPGR